MLADLLHSFFCSLRSMTVRFVERHRERIRDSISFLSLPPFSARSVTPSSGRNSARKTSSPRHIAKGSSSGVPHLPTFPSVSVLVKHGWVHHEALLRDIHAELCSLGRHFFLRIEERRNSRCVCLIFWHLGISQK